MYHELSNINMDFEDVILLMEIKGISNDTFHRGWQEIDEAKEQLMNQQFPGDMKQYKGLYKNFSMPHILGLLDF
jgi:hypothetical protein